MDENLEIMALAVRDESLDLVTFAEKMMLDSGSLSLQECFTAAVDLAAYLTAIRNKSIVVGSRYIPKTVQTIGEMATKGDLEAAKILFDYVGMRTKTPMAQVNTQVNIQAPVLRDIITIDEDGNIV